MISLALFLSMASIQDNADSLSREVDESKRAIEELKTSIAEEEKDWAEEATRAAEQETRRGERYDKFKAEKIELELSLAELESSIEEGIRELKTLGMRENEYEARFAAIGRRMGEEIAAMETLMEGTIPWRLDKRLEVLSLLRKDLAEEDISHEEAFNRLWVIHENEQRLAQEAEVYSGDWIEEDGEAIQVKYMRAGKRVLAFASPDGAKLGLLVSAAEDAPRWLREGDMDFETRKALRVAIETAEGKALPGFVPVPIWKTPILNGATP